MLLVVALAMLPLTAKAAASQVKRCGLVTYAERYNGQSYSGQDTVFVVHGATSCARARVIDRRADEGLRNAGWRCRFSQHATVTTCISSSGKSEIQGLAYTPPPSNPTRVPAPAPTPTPTTTPTVPTTPVPTPPVPTASCYPLSNEGTCYEPGEYCRTIDEGATGLAGDGETITCEYNNGWRWEPT